ncbi:DUF421 domain-containing protein [Radiobacillus kanasensis]|uniref:YetF domain-containing protein n=1 Tax=Radiobacillus kanasensis TaxID=2844358 RepID=UPI001E5B7608|nr:DUF421 domain-containing protein [Radiobacillus kanasensis]UFT99172.1 DUF421 domain-containing protein [Radiobacillus kanasensis]
MNPVLDVSLRALFGFCFLLFLTRLLGKKQLSQMTFFTYITGIALGNIAGDMVVHKDIKVMDGFIGMGLWAVLTIVVEYISLKYAKARVLLDGEPTIVIKDGKLLKKAMNDSRLNVDDLTMLLRDKDVFSVADVDYAILEPNGKLSVLKKEEKENVTKKDMQIQLSHRKYIPMELIVDGKVVKRNLREVNKTMEWLEQQLKIKGAERVQDVFYAELKSDGNIFVDLK